MVDTGENTILDALRLILPDDKSATRGPYAVISAHRLETVYRRDRLACLVTVAERVSEALPVYFVLHPITRTRLEGTQLMDHLAAAPNVALLPRMGYRRFIALASSARAVLTDGGGNQEELAYLGVRTIVLRRRTERHHGLESTAIITGLNPVQVMHALQYDAGAGGKRQPLDLEHYAGASPSARIADDLALMAA